MSENPIFVKKFNYKNEENLAKPSIKVSNLGLMEKQAVVVPIKGSLNFSKKIDTSVEKQEKKPPTKVVKKSDISTTPLPKKKKSGFENFNPERVRKGKNSYTIPELLKWYKYFSGVELNKGQIQRTALEQVLINSYKKHNSEST